MCGQGKEPTTGPSAIIALASVVEMKSQHSRIDALLVVGSGLIFGHDPCSCSLVMLRDSKSSYQHSHHTAATKTALRQMCAPLSNKQRM